MENDIERHVFSDETKNVLIIGPGGTGKSYIIKNLLLKAKDKNIKIEATASTGVAAVNINGTTLHRFFGVGLCQGHIDNIIRKVMKNYDATQRITNTKILFIDEISMIGAELFDKLDQVAKYIRKNNEPFGGIKLILSGDFLQLPPVKDKWIFLSNIWEKLQFKLFFLKEPKRYNDLEFYDMLMRAREGVLTQNDIGKIIERTKAYDIYINNNNNDDVEKNIVKPTILYSQRIDVDFINKNEINKLSSDIHLYNAHDFVLPNDEKCDQIFLDISTEKYKQELDYLAPVILELKIGTQVMITRNLNVEEGICNGTRAVVTELNTETITVKTCSGIELLISPVIFSFEDKDIKICRKQLPIIVAFALTIHKSQGSTIDFCIIDLGPTIFSPGQGYVALSRVRDWNSLLINGFLRKSIKADKKAIEYVNYLEELYYEDNQN